MECGFCNPIAKYEYLKSHLGTTYDVKGVTVLTAYASMLEFCEKITKRQEFFYSFERH